MSIRTSLDWWVSGNRVGHLRSLHKQTYADVIRTAGRKWTEFSLTRRTLRHDPPSVGGYPHVQALGNLDQMMTRCCCRCLGREWGGLGYPGV